jgi:N-acetylmuramoyl-L-alanine amidase
MNGIRFIMLVPEMHDISLEERVRRANAIYDSIAEKCFLLSIHANAGMGTGFEVWTSKGETKSDAYADIFMEEAEREPKEFKMRKDYTDGDSDKEDQFYILCHTKMPAVLTENLFMDTERDCRFLLSDEGRERIAEFHFRAIKRIVDTYGKG